MKDALLDDFESIEIVENPILSCSCCWNIVGTSSRLPPVVLAQVRYRSHALDIKKWFELRLLGE